MFPWTPQGAEQVAQTRDAEKLDAREIDSKPDRDEESEGG